MLGIFRRAKDNTADIPSNRDLTTKHIALSLLYTFIISIIALFIVNGYWITVDPKLKENVKIEDERKGWFELFKNALILLGTALTTVIGYYFGQREGAIKAAEAQKEVEKTEQQAKQIVDQVTQQRDEAIKEAATDNDPEQIDEASRSES